ncbi:cysteine hydrolase family protein [Legionella micdadei]|uniref:Nicotinamidase-related amidase n=1 Tax=Legionella micdadei TaxID=451 RepID=A0A098GFI2_LEGMI|nr:isochorismatase family protein [Legionella micdadei]ARG98106.1 hypothetical protein B6N58_10800 [Legionella micdadei]KTD30057.1 Isochorismatase family protein [Legionella micdadei]NSL18568.1 isochorismatase family protein [Legionella micdadei]CEG60251.1 protein of unknown function [Legionella micdadei]SCY57802.1 Nicotinamidase-related amidase [Legionella micdadei]
MLSQEESSKTLIDEASKLIRQGIKIAVLIIDEYSPEGSLEDNKINVADKQERLLSWAVKEKLLVCFISDKNNREGLTKLVKNYKNVLFIEKGDANGFGDGYSWHVPRYADTGLDDALKENNITHIIIMGFHVHCCVQITAGAHDNISDYGKGALHRGYKILTAGDILKSSADSPSRDRCSWKDKEGVSYFNTSESSPLISNRDQYGGPKFGANRNILLNNTTTNHEDLQNDGCMCAIC